ncbi:uncharacterized protein A1O9_08454, partial [Exophiala aquamarina CBS 119918]
MEGYDSLSAYAATYPSLQIHRSFSILNQRTVNLLEAELAEKERQLVIAIENDRQSEDSERRRYSLHFGTLLKANPVGDNNYPKQKALALEVAGLLKQYIPDTDDLLLQNHALNKLRTVRKFDLECVRNVLKRQPDIESGFFLSGAELSTWAEENERDLVSLRNHNDDLDALSTLIDWLVQRFYFGIWKKAPRERFPVPRCWAPLHPADMAWYPDGTLTPIVGIVTIVLASALPSLSAFGLFWVTDPLIRIGMVVLLSFLFSSALALVGVPRRIDAFVASSTYIAVLLVFVGS